MESESFGRFKVSAAPAEDARTVGRFRLNQVGELKLMPFN